MQDVIMLTHVSRLDYLTNIFGLGTLEARALLEG